MVEDLVAEADRKQIEGAFVKKMFTPSLDLQSLNERATVVAKQEIDLTDFKIPEEECDAIYLSHQEIATIYQTDLSGHPHLIEYRDLFVLGCLTGLRFSDFSTLKP